MAIVQLADVVVAEQYNKYTAINNPETSAFVKSGIAVRQALLDDLFNQNGYIAHVPFWDDLSSDDEPNLGDDTENAATPLDVGATDMKVRKLFLNQIYKAANLVNELTTEAPMQHIKNRFGAYWMNQWNRHIIAALIGVYADNVANDSSDMVNDVHGALNSDVTANTLFTREAMVNAAFTAGDKFDDYVAIGVHSMVYARMVKNDDIDQVPDSQGNLLIPTFMGRRVIVDDQLPMTAAAGTDPGDAAAKYTSILFGAGAVGYGMGVPLKPSFVKEEELQGNGMGTQIIGERVNWIIHPFGYDFLSSSIASIGGPSRAELQEAAQWDRKVERKLVPLAYLVTNG